MPTNQPTSDFTSNQKEIEQRKANEERHSLKKLDNISESKYFRMH